MNFLKGMEIFMIQTLHIVPEYNEDLIYPAICKSMEALNIAADLRPEMKIVIKPNMVMAKSPDFPATTHPLNRACSISPSPRVPAVSTMPKP